MPAIARIGDPATQHPCGGQANPAEGSPNVFVEGVAVHRLGDRNVAHSFNAPPTCVPHSTTLVSGSGSVFVNGKAVARVGDGYSCGMTITAGASTVYAGG